MKQAGLVSTLLMVGTLGLGGCALAAKEAPSAGEPAPAAAPGPTKPAADATKSNLPSTQRKVIRNADLSIEVASPAAAESKVSSLIERLGGYVASSERSTDADEGERKTARVSLSLRVPAERLDEALREIKRLGAGAETERIGSEDVTDEFIDVSARVANQRHLEQQLVTILAQANTVEGSLKVHQELTNVRTEIDRLEGRKRFLETESALAKISLTLAPLRPVVAVSGTEFGVSARRAASDSAAVAAGIVTFAIRAAGILAPLALLFGLPVAGVLLWLKRRQRRLLATASA
jgi:hypothetical protein